MIKKILLVLLVLLIAARLLSPEYEVSSSKMEAFAVPEFALDTLEDNGKITTSDFKDGIFLLTFMSYGCGYCTKQARYFSDNEADFPIYVISVDLDSAGVKSWKETNQINKYYEKFGLLGNDIGKMFDVNVIPISFIIKDGMVVRKIIGVIDEDRISSIRQMMTEVKSVNQSEE